jgi:glyoxylate reductase
MPREMAKIFVTRKLPFPALDRLREAHDVEEWPGDLPPEDLGAQLGEAEGLLSLVTDRVDASAIEAAPRLRAIANMAVGTDNIDL